jgi:hypothetical protein
MNPHLTIKTNYLPVMFTALIISAIFIFPGKISAQDAKKTSKNEKTIQMKIVTTENGKTTVIDTTITTTEPGDLKEYEYQMRVMDDQVKDMDKEMKEMEIELSGDMGDVDIDTLVIDNGDSIHKKIIIHGGRGMGRGNECDHMRMEDCCPGMPFGFSWNSDDDDNVVFSAPFPGRLESILGSIPMGAVKGFKIKEKKGGKRIIIDIDDDYPMMMQNFNYSLPVPKVVRTPRTIIIQKEVNTPPPPPPAAPGKPEPPKPPSVPEKG